MSVTTLTCALVTAGAAVAAPAAASPPRAQTIRIYDPAGDSVRSGSADATGMRTSVDIVGATYQYVPGRFVRVVVRVRDFKPLINGDHWHAQGVTIRLAGHSDLSIQDYKVSRLPYAPHSTGRLALGENYESACAGDTAKVDTARNRFVVTIPTSCLMTGGLRADKLQLWSSADEIFEDGAQVVYSDEATAPRRLR